MSSTVFELELKLIHFGMVFYRWIGAKLSNQVRFLLLEWFLKKTDSNFKSWQEKRNTQFFNLIAQSFWLWQFQMYLDLIFVSMLALISGKKIKYRKCLGVIKFFFECIISLFQLLIDRTLTTLENPNLFSSKLVFIYLSYPWKKMCRK